MKRATSRLTQMARGFDNSRGNRQAMPKTWPKSRNTRSDLTRILKERYDFLQALQVSMNEGINFEAKTQPCSYVSHELCFFFDTSIKSFRYHLIY